jgi:osomolarity two-component system response regulator SSK1
MAGRPQMPNIGPSSHRSPSSPLPAEALEYFSEKAAKMGSNGASGMMINSPDGRPAGIFFQPKTATSLGLRTPGSLASRRTTSADERFGSAVAANQNRIFNRLPSHNNASNNGGSSSSSLNSNGKSSPSQPNTPQKKASMAKTQTVAEAAEDNVVPPVAPVTSPIVPPSSLVGEHPLGTKQAMQTFTLNAQPSTALRPSAQPQAGLLIGAGFTPSNKRGGGPKKPTTNMEILPPIKVLIVEDNEINVTILSKFLKQRKIQFGVAKNGREAVDQWQTGGYHLILMDIQLPVMDGIEATKEIRRLERCHNGPDTSTTPPASAAVNVCKNGLLTAGSAHENGNSNGNAALVSPSTMLNSLKPSVIIVALTASILNSDRVAALAAGCNDFLNKPVNLRWLERKVIEWGSMQYLIGFRDVNDDLRRQKRYQSLTEREARKSNGLVQQGFVTGPDRLAREMAGRLHIGARKVR